MRTVQASAGNRAAQRLLAPGGQVQRFYGVVEEADKQSGVTYSTVGGVEYKWFTDTFDPAVWEVSPIKTGWWVRNLYQRRKAAAVEKVAEEKKEVVEEKKEVVEEKPPEKPKEEAPAQYEGVVQEGRSPSGFVIPHEGLGNLIVDAGGFKLAKNQTVTYTIHKPNPYITKAIVVRADARPEAQAVDEQMRQAANTRADAIRKAGFMGKTKVTLIGVPNKSGARKHYTDADAIATTDSDVINLVRKQAFSVTKVEAQMDGFIILLGTSSTGSRLTVVGEIRYKDATKKEAREIAVFHAGPQQ